MPDTIPKKHGGKRPNSGRPAMPDSEKHTIKMPALYWNIVRPLCEGNLSEAVRAMVASHVAANPGKYDPETFEPLIP